MRRFRAPSHHANIPVLQVASRQFPCSLRRHRSDSSSGQLGSLNLQFKVVAMRQPPAHQPRLSLLSPSRAPRQPKCPDSIRPGVLATIRTPSATSSHRPPVEPRAALPAPRPPALPEANCDDSPNVQRVDTPARLRLVQPGVPRDIERDRPAIAARIIDGLDAGCAPTEPPAGTPGCPSSRPPSRSRPYPRHSTGQWTPIDENTLPASSFR